MTPLTVSSQRTSISVVKVEDLDHDSPLPLFEQLADLLRRQIDDGTLTVRLPSEAALVQEFGISRGTAHRAVMILVGAGYVRISRGKGTFVNPPTERRNL